MLCLCIGLYLHAHESDISKLLLLFFKVLINFATTEFDFKGTFTQNTAMPSDCMFFLKG